MSKPILCIDFDGVIHDYRNGWQDGSIYGELTHGFLDWAAKAQEIFKLVVYSSRSKQPGGVDLMKRWMLHRGFKPAEIAIEFAHEKPPAFLTIDDRCIRFEGVWTDPRLAPEVLREFTPWMTPKSSR
jgi:hypothetical protein